jgi:hypothetical protein
MVNKMKTKVHKLEADSVEVTYTEEKSLVESEYDEKDDILVYRIMPRFTKTVRNVPNKRTKEK